MTVISCSMHDVIVALTVAYDLLVGALLVPVIGAMMWPRGTTAGALASIAVGATLVTALLAWAGLDSDLPIYAGLGGSLVVYLVVSTAGYRARAPAIE
jgi:SSS family solute:Na+ symporter